MERRYSDVRRFIIPPITLPSLSRFPLLPWPSFHILLSFHRENSRAFSIAELCAGIKEQRATSLLGGLQPLADYIDLHEDYTSTDHADPREVLWSAPRSKARKASNWQMQWVTWLSSVTSTCTRFFFLDLCAPRSNRAISYFAAYFFFFLLVFSFLSYVRLRRTFMRFQSAITWLQMIRSNEIGWRNYQKPETKREMKTEETRGGEGGIERRKKKETWRNEAYFSEVIGSRSNNLE